MDRTVGTDVSAERVEAAARDERLRDKLRQVALELFPDGTTAYLVVRTADGSRGTLAVPLAGDEA